MLVEASNLTKYYGDNMACQDICLSLEEGQVFGLLGPNGAGKSTLVKMLLGLVHATAGQARILGFPSGHQQAKSKTGYLPELFRQYEWLTAYEIMEFNARVYNLPARSQKRIILDTLDMVGLLGRETEKVKGFSKGMQQRLGLAAAILHSPSLLFLDEPTSALDPIGRREVRDIITIIKDKGTTVFLNSHLLSEVEMTCTHLGFIKRGRLVHAGPIETYMNETHEISIDAENIPQGQLDIWMKEKKVVAHNAHTLLLKVDDRNEIPSIIHQLITGGAQIYRVDSKKRGLEDVFMELMENKPEVDL